MATKACRGLKVKSKKVNPYSVGGILGSTATGVAGGAAGGPPGMIIGGAIGLAKGIFGHLGEEKAAQVAGKAESQRIESGKKAQLASLTAKEGKLVGPGGIEINPYSLKDSLRNESAQGGPLSGSRMFDPESNIEEFNQGGTHEQNPNGGIQVGIGANGKPDTVEQGETAVIINGRKFIFSARVEFRNKGEFPTFMKDSTFADASKNLEEAFKDRLGPEDKATKKAFLERLALKQETIKELQENPGLEEEGQQNQFQGGGFGGGLFDTNFMEQYAPSGYDYNGPLLPTKTEEARSEFVTDPNALPSSVYDPEAWEKEYGQYSDIGVLSPDGNAPTPFWKDDEKLGKAVLGLGALGSLAGVFGSMRARNKMRKPGEVKAHLLDASGITENLVNRQDILREVAHTQQSAIGALGAKASGDFGAFAANVAGIQGKTAQATSRAMLQASELDAKEKSRVQELKLGAQRFNVQSQNQADLANEQNLAAYEAQRAAYSQGIVANISSLGQTAVNYAIGTQAGKYGGLAEQLAALMSKG